MFSCVLVRVQVKWNQRNDKFNLQNYKLQTTWKWPRLLLMMLHTHTHTLCRSRLLYFPSLSSLFLLLTAQSQSFAGNANPCQMFGVINRRSEHHLHLPRPKKKNAVQFHLGSFENEQKRKSSHFARLSINW